MHIQNRILWILYVQSNWNGSFAHFDHVNQIITNSVQAFRYLDHNTMHLWEIKHWIRHLFNSNQERCALTGVDIFILSIHRWIMNRISGWQMGKWNSSTSFMLHKCIPSIKFIRFSLVTSANYYYACILTNE